jgi:serralysin
MTNTILGTSASETLIGTAGSDIIEGLGGNDNLQGGGGADTLVGGIGADTLFGGSGSDLFLYDARQWGADVIADWGKGDKIDVSALGVSDLATLQPYLTQHGADSVFSTYFGGSTESITISGAKLAALSFVFNTSAVGLDQEGTFGHDVLFGGRGADTLNGAGEDDQLNGGAKSDVLIGGAGNDTLRGGAGADLFLYDARQWGSDVIADWSKGDRIDVSALGVSDLATLQPYLTQHGADSVFSAYFGGSTETITISNTKLAALSFVFNTSTAALDQEGTFGHDVLFGGKGADTLNGAGEDDQLNGGGNSDVLIGGAGNDTLRGGLGSDLFLYDARQWGSDVIADWNKVDKIDISALGVADLATLQPYLSQDGKDAVLSSFFSGGAEDITFTNTKLAALSFVFNTSTAALDQEGTFGRDVLFGGNGADTLNGAGEDDQLNGGAGADTLIGGQGADIMRGGTGKDLFQFSTGDSGVTSNLDMILDFSHAERDLIDLHNIDADSSKANDQAFKLVGKITGLGQMKITETDGHFLVELNYTGDTHTDMAFEVTSATTLVSNDFVL